jgi:thymidylate synthase (FAD)
MGDDLFVVNAARVSMGKWKAALDDADIKLLGYLARNNHWTPFAHPQISMRVTAPIMVSRQLEKHIAGLVMGSAIPARNEISRRYVDTPPEFYDPCPVIWRERAENVKQGSGNALADSGNRGQAEAVYQDALSATEDAYQELLELGVCPEQARLVLPAATMTQWIWTGSLAAFARICRLRLDPHAQAETREVARQIAEICTPLFPYAWTALLVAEGR